MHGIILFGRGLVGLALLSFLGEIVARAYLGAGGYLPAGELWATLFPKSYEAMRSWFRHGPQGLWTYGVGPMLMLPAWLLSGGPGVWMLWWGERRHGSTEAAEAAEAAFLYDELEKRAKEEGYPGDADSPTATGGEDVVASAREAEADLAREPIAIPPRADREGGETNPASESGDKNADDQDSGDRGAEARPIRPPS